MARLVSVSSLPAVRWSSEPLSEADDFVVAQRHGAGGEVLDGGLRARRAKRCQCFSKGGEQRAERFEPSGEVSAFRRNRDVSGVASQSKPGLMIGALASASFGGSTHERSAIR